MIVDHLALKFEKAVSVRPKTKFSGLAFDLTGQLWAVDESQPKLLRISESGHVSEGVTVGNKELEGICFDGRGRVLAVDEDAAKVLIYDPDTGEKKKDRKLVDLTGAGAIQGDIEKDDKNGLEGVVYDPVRLEIGLLKEADPGQLIWVTEDLDRVVAVDVLNETSGFEMPAAKIGGKKSKKLLDFSGVCYDATRDLFWIVSDRGSRVFAFDRRKGRAVGRAMLTQDDGGGGVEKAEGVSFGPKDGRMYVVSDAVETMYVYEVGK